MNQLRSKPTESTVHNKVCDEQLLEKPEYVECLPKVDNDHIIAMVMHLVYPNFPKEAMEDQGRAISTIFRAIDVKTQSVIELPMASDTETRNQVRCLQASTALTCLLGHFFAKIARRSGSECILFRDSLNDMRNPFKIRLASGR